MGILSCEFFQKTTFGSGCAVTMHSTLAASPSEAKLISDPVTLGASVQVFIHLFVFRAFKLSRMQFIRISRNPNEHFQERKSFDDIFMQICYKSHHFPDYNYLLTVPLWISCWLLRNAKWKAQLSQKIIYFPSLLAKKGKRGAYETLGFFSPTASEFHIHCQRSKRQCPFPE